MPLEESTAEEFHLELNRPSSQNRNWLLPTGLQNPASVVANATGSIYAAAPRAFFGGLKIRF